MLKLIQNELIKISSQVMWRISVLLILVIAVVSPIFLRLVLPPSYFAVDIKITSEEIHVSEYERYKKAYENSDDNSIEKGYYKAGMETEEFFRKNNIDTMGWKNQYANYYISMVCGEEALRLAQQGHSLDDIIEKNDVSSYGLAVIERGFTYDTNDNPIETYYFNFIVSFKINGYSYDSIEFDFDDIPLYIEKTHKAAEELKTLLITGKEEYGKQKANEARELLAEEQRNLEAAKNAYDLNGIGRYEYDVSLNRCEVLEIIARCWESFARCDEENEERIIRMISWNTDNILNSADRFAGRDESYFTDGVYYSEVWGRRTVRYSTYEEYIEKYDEKVREDYINSAEAVLYCIENQVFPYESGAISSREYFDGFITANVYVIMFFIIFLAAVIMSSEFGTGTIRLLVIRPRARWKLLLSKLLTVGIFGAALLIITGLISLGMTLIVFGWGDLSEPYIEAGRNGIRIIPPILYTIRNALTDCVSMLFTACLTFLISVLFKKGIFAIAVSVLVYAFGGLAAKISLDLIYDLPFLKYTVIPYNMALNGARYDAIARVQSWFNPVMTDYGLSLESGVVIMLVTSFILIALSFVIFDRQQIKN